MKAGRINLENLEKLHLVFRGFRSHDGVGYWFRGQARLDWELLPKAGRKEYYLPDNRDLKRFDVWKRQAIAYCSLPARDLEQLALAQHHGFATRFLDWSMNPLVACYFACSDHLSADGVVYILEAPEQFLTDEANLSLLSEVEGVFAYIPNAIAPRVMNQKGIFSVHCDARQEIFVKDSRFGKAQPNLVQLVIPSTLKGEVIRLLDDYGINRSVLFPDLDGLSAYINSRTEGVGKRA